MLPFIANNNALYTCVCVYVHTYIHIGMYLYTYLGVNCSVTRFNTIV